MRKTYRICLRICQQKDSMINKNVCFFFVCLSLDLLRLCFVLRLESIICDSKMYANTLNCEMAMYYYEKIG